MTNESSQDKDKDKEGADEIQKRYNYLDPNQVLSVIPMVPSHDVLDVGSGSGYFTIPLGKHLFDGKIYAVDSDDAQIEAVRSELERVRLTNTEVLKFDGDKIPLEDDSVDGALIAFYLNQLRSPKKVLGEAARCLRKGGWLIVLEWVKRETNQGPPVNKRTDVDEMREIVEKEGFRFSSRHDLNSQQYMLIMRK